MLASIWGAGRAIEDHEPAATLVAHVLYMLSPRLLVFQANNVIMSLMRESFADIVHVKSS